MLVIKLELWPQGDQAKARPMGEIRIANDGSGTPEKGNYRVELSHSGMYVGKRGVYRRGRVEGFPRRASVYEILRRALESALRRGGRPA